MFSYIITGESEVNLQGKDLICYFLEIIQELKVKFKYVLSNLSEIKEIN